MKITFDDTTLELTPTGKSYRAAIDDEIFEVEILRNEAERGRLDLRIIRLSDSQSVENHPLSVTISAYISSDGSKRWVTIKGQTFVLTKSSSGRRKGAGHDHASDLVAPMPGLVRSVNVVEGESVAKGQTLLVLEAMKMEIRVQAKNDGVVKKLFVQQGQTVEREQVLIEIE
jgi:biotin carboxyl carrier protein